MCDKALEAMIETLQAKFIAQPNNTLLTLLAKVRVEKEYRAFIISTTMNRRRKK